MLSGRFTKFSKANLNHDLNNDNDQKGEGVVPSIWGLYITLDLIRPRPVPKLGPLEIDWCFRH